MENENKNIFVLFSPGLGGNHVANLLATDTRYTPRATSIDYLNHKGNNAHIVDMIKQFDVIEKANTLTGNIICTHFGIFYWKFQENIISKFKNRQIIIIDLPVNSKLLGYKRYKKYSKLKQYFFEEQKTLYTPETVNRLFGEKDFFTVPAEMIFNDSVEFFINYATTQMNFKLNHDECKKMHNIWIQKIKEDVNNAAVSQTT
jgi:hypothetical protein